MYGETTRSAPARASFSSAEMRARPADHEELRVEGPGAQDHVDILGVGVDRRDEAAGALDAGRPERGVVGRVALDHEVAVGAGAFERGGVHVDHDEPLAVVAELPGDRRSDPPVAAEHEVSLQGCHRPFHPAPLPPPAGRFGDKVLRDETDGTEDEQHAGERDDHRPGAARVVERLDLAEPGGRDADHRHVERVAERPPLDDHVADGPDDEDERDDHQPGAQPGCARERAQGIERSELAPTSLHRLPLPGVTGCAPASYQG